MDFPRDLRTAITAATAWWSLVNRREFTGAALAAAAYATPVSRWLIQPADADAGHEAGQGAAQHTAIRRVGAHDIAELHEAAEHARHVDSKYGGGSSGASMVTACLRERVAPMLRGTYSDQTGRQLFAATAQLSRLAGYSAWDVGHQNQAQRHYIQALRLARAAGDIPLGGYVLACMSLQAGLAEARAHARGADRRAAGLTLAHSERLLGQAKPTDNDPEWVDFFTYARLAADATEIHRDLAMPHMVMRFEELATMPSNLFVHSYGMRSAIVGSGHLQAGRLEEGLALGHRSIEVLSKVASVRSLEYLKDLNTRLDRWSTEAAVIEFRHRARTELGLTA